MWTTICIYNSESLKCSITLSLNMCLLGPEKMILYYSISKNVSSCFFIKTLEKSMLSVSWKWKWGLVSIFIMENIAHV